jgi:hypothetical protein
MAPPTLVFQAASKLDLIQGKAASADTGMVDEIRKRGQRGGFKDGKARAEKMIPEERSESARNAATARGDKKRREEEGPS